MRAETLQAASELLDYSSEAETLQHTSGTLMATATERATSAFMASAIAPPKLDSGGFTVVAAAPGHPKQQTNSKVFMLSRVLSSVTCRLHAWMCAAAAVRTNAPPEVPAPEQRLSWDKSFRCYLIYLKASSPDCTANQLQALILHT